MRFSSNSILATRGSADEDLSRLSAPDTRTEISSQVLRGVLVHPSTLAPSFHHSVVWFAVSASYLRRTTTWTPPGPQPQRGWEGWHHYHGQWPPFYLFKPHLKALKFSRRRPNRSGRKDRASPPHFVYIRPWTVSIFWTIREWTANAAAGRLLASLAAPSPVNADGEGQDDLLEVSATTR